MLEIEEPIINDTVGPYQGQSMPHPGNAATTVLTAVSKAINANIKVTLRM
jgi:hypothetical protein